MFKISVFTKNGSASSLDLFCLCFSSPSGRRSAEVTEEWLHTTLPQESTIPLLWLLSRWSKPYLCPHQQRGHKCRRDAEIPSGEVPAITPCRRCCQCLPNPWTAPPLKCLLLLWWPWPQARQATLATGCPPGHALPIPSQPSPAQPSKTGETCKEVYLIQPLNYRRSNLRLSYNSVPQIYRNRNIK